MTFPTRRLFTALLPLSLILPLVAISARAQEVPPQVDNFKMSGVGRINADAVYVRSGAGDNYYPTTKLNKGAEVTVVGGKLDWLKVIPPEGGFSYIAKAFVDKDASGWGKVNRDNVLVRAGSELTTIKTTVQKKLGTGDKVQITGEVDEYYKIKPPAETFVYVNKQFVDFIRAIPAVAGNDQAAQQAPIAQQESQSQQTQQTPPSAPIANDLSLTVPPIPSTIAEATPSTQPASETSQIASSAGGAATQPAAAINPVELQFDKLEADFTVASGKPIEQQPVAELLGGYKKLIASNELPESMRRIATFRAQTLEVRAKARDEFVAVQKQQEESKKKQQALKAEQDEIAQQIKKTEVQLYTAVGTLRTSSLQQGGGTLYRLTDPATGRTVVYIRSSDDKIGQNLGQFIGVKGDLTADPQLALKVVTPTKWSQVDPNQLYRQISAQVVPPSMVPQGTQASTGNQ